MVYCNKTLYVRNVRSKESEKSNLCQKLYVDVSLETPEQCTASVLRKLYVDVSLETPEQCTASVLRKLYVDVSLETPEQCTASVLRKSSLRGAGNMSKALLTYCNILWFPGSSAEV